MKSAIKMAWEHGGTDFQSRFDKSTAQAEEMKEGRYAFCKSRESQAPERGPDLGKAIAVE
jgi:hypothetical protein